MYIPSPSSLKPVMEPSQRDGFEGAVRVLLHGFDALRLEYQVLAEKYYKLEQQHAATVQQLESARPDSPDTSIHQQSTTVDDPPPRKLHEWLEQHRRLNEPSTKSTIPDIKKAELAHMKLQSLLHRAQVTQSYMSDLELDFTTHGNVGRLGCPFSRTRRGGSSLGSRDRLSAHRPPPSHCPVSHTESNKDTPHLEHDPAATSLPKVPEQCGIEAELPPPAPASASALDPGAACPIRFLDQRSPEEIAQYVEEHKHQVPRSHEVCVKRFQDNSKSIQQLDAKYGSLVNMLQELGIKHKSMLPGAGQAGAHAQLSDDEHRSDPRVEKWALSVNESLSRAAPVPSNHAAHDHDPLPSSSSSDHNEPHDRIPHFDRPLKEIRVGESPSRPWGISIPPQYMDHARSDTSPPHSVPAPPLLHHDASKPTADPRPTTQPPRGCPFHKLSTQPVAGAPASAPAPGPAPPAPLQQDQAHSHIDTDTHTHTHALPPSIPSSIAAQKPHAAPALFINRGVAVLNSPSLFARTASGTAEHAGFVFENYGTVFVDDANCAMEFLRSR